MFNDSILRIEVCVLQAQSLMADASKPRGVLLAETFEKIKPTPDPKGWWVSEKLDGVRAYYHDANQSVRWWRQLFWVEVCPCTPQ